MLKTLALLLSATAQPSLLLLVPLPPSSLLEPLGVNAGEGKKDKLGYVLGCHSYQEGSSVYFFGFAHFVRSCNIIIGVDHFNSNKWIDN
jgi:hypothetical protein